MTDAAEPAFAVVDADGRIDPMSVRQHITSCKTYAFIHDLRFRGDYSVIPVKIVRLVPSEVDELRN